MMVVAWFSTDTSESMGSFPAGGREQEEGTSSTGRIQAGGHCLVCVFVLLVLLPCGDHAVSVGCGGFFELGTGSQTFYSPDYPSVYPAAINCVWIISTDENHQIKLTFSFTGERYSGSCSDYIEIRDGGPFSNIMNTYCDRHSSVVLTSTNVWMYVKLKTDQISSTGTFLQAIATAVYNKTSPLAVTNQVPDLSSQIGISVTVGVVLISVICLFATLVEARNVWIGHKTEIILEREMQRQVQQNKVSKIYSKFIGPSANPSIMIFEKPSDQTKRKSIF